MIKKKPSLLIHVTILGIVNLACMLLLAFLMGSLPETAQELKTLRNLSLNQQTGNDVKILTTDILSSKSKAEKLKDYFPDENGLISFIKEIDVLKKDGVVTHFSFASNNVIQDKTRFLGVPVIIEFKGSPSRVDAALQKVQTLPFFIRSINVEIKQSPTSKEITLKYGGILYVDEKINH